MRDKSFTRIFTCLFHLLKFNICKSIKKCVLLGLPLYSDLKFNISFSGLKAEITLKINSSMLGFPGKLNLCVYFLLRRHSSFFILTSIFQLRTYLLIIQIGGQKFLHKCNRFSFSFCIIFNLILANFF